MPVFEAGDVRIRYESWGDGPAVLLAAPGGVRSAISFWERAPWNPIEYLADRFLVVAMDQRNAGDSLAPVRPNDGWHAYTGDQLGLMDYLGHKRFHFLGMCIGGAFGVGLVAAAPERLRSAVLLQPIGLDGNRDAFYEKFDDWAADLRASTHPDVTDEVWRRFRSNLYDGDFMFSVDRDVARTCQVPLLVLRGNGYFHPAGISEELVRLAPGAELVERWKDGDAVSDGRRQVEVFLAAH